MSAGPVLSHEEHQAELDNMVSVSNVAFTASEMRLTQS